MAITAAIIRTKLLDTASKNTFLGEEEFSTPEITTAITEALSYWNATQPLVADLEYASADAIPSAYDEPFSKGIIAILLQDKSRLLIRNRQPVAVEGVGIDINARADAYVQLAASLMAEFTQWILSTKRHLASIQIITASPTSGKSVISLRQQTAETNTFSVADDSGNTITVTPYTATLYVKEYASADSALMTKTLTKASATTLTLSTDDDDMNHAGTVFGEVVLVESGVTKYRIPVYINVEPALSSTNSRETLTIGRLRDVLHDRAGENYILATTEFQDADMAKAIINVVDLWNSAPPAVGRFAYTPMTFPEEYIGQWEDAASGYLLKEVANKLMRNAYSPLQGETLDISRKATEYMQLGDMKIKEFTAWARDIKYSLNMASAWGYSNNSSFG
jgi:hypothetical protein